VFDLTSIALNLAIIVLDFKNSGTKEKDFHDVIREISAVAIFLMYVKLFYFLRIFKLTAPLVRMIVDVTFSIKVFLLLFVLFLIGVANSFFILA